jgi:cysteine desulfuration protein SufE
MSTLETLKAREAEVVDEFDFFDEWMDRYEHIIAQGKSLPAADAAIKTDDNLIRGCQSKVWITAEKRDGLVYFTADSDAIITRGLVALLLRVCNGLEPEVLAQADFGFLTAIGLTEHLSPTRANGLQSMMKQIRLYGVAFQAVN